MVDKKEIRAVALELVGANRRMSDDFKTVIEGAARVAAWIEESDPEGRLEACKLSCSVFTGATLSPAYLREAVGSVYDFLNPPAEPEHSRRTRKKGRLTRG